jgi:hypothetical protein
MRLRNLFRWKSSEDRIKGSAQWRNKINEEDSERNVRESRKNYGEIRITKWWSGGNECAGGYEKLEGEKVVKETAIPWGCHDVSLLFTFLSGREFGGRNYREVDVNQS